MNSLKKLRKKYMITSKIKKLVIFGLGDLAQIAREYFTYDSEYEVVGFTVDREHLPADYQLSDFLIVPFDEVEERFPPDSYEMHIAIVYGNLNRTRAEACWRAKDKGYKLASYISSWAFVWPNAKIGEHAFIFEDNTIQPFVEIGDNCILWSGNHVGHHSKIGNNVFISSHVVVSGWCDIGDNCFIGVNSTLANGTSIGKKSWISHGCVINGNVPEHSMVKSSASEVIELNEESLMRSLERARR